MPNYAAGAGHQLLYKAEPTWGQTTVVASGFKKVRHTSCSMDLQKDALTSAELRNDRQVVDLRHGVKRVAGELGFELSGANYDDFIAASLFGAFSTGTFAGARSLSITSVPGTYKFTGTNWTTLGIQTGDFVKFSGFVNAVNNSVFKVVSASATDLVVQYPDGTNPTLITEGPVSVSLGNVARAGTTRKSFVMERGFTDQSSPSYGLFLGCMINSMSLSVKPNSMITGSFGFVGKTATYSAASSCGTPAEADYTFSPYDSFSGAIYEGGYGSGDVIAYVTGIDFSLNNNLNPSLVIGTNTATGIVAGRINVTGTLQCYFQDLVMMDKFINETNSSLMFTLGGVHGGQKTQTWVFPKIKYSGGSVPVQGDGPITMSMPFTAIYDTSSGTSLYVSRVNV